MNEIAISNIRQALDALRYNAAINQNFANGEFVQIESLLTEAISALTLDQQDESVLPNSAYVAHLDEMAYFEDADKSVLDYARYSTLGGAVVEAALLGNEPQSPTDALLAELNALAESEFDDGAAFEELPANEFIEDTPHKMPVWGTLTKVVGKNIVIDTNDTVCILWATDDVIALAPTLINKVIGVDYADDSVTVDFICELPF